MENQPSNLENSVTYQSKDFIGVITLNRPLKRNALNTKVWDALNQAILMAEQDPEARVVMVRGKGKSFCAGMDLSP
jgi:enoyl-CoA hydratase/carnithine racemase